MQIAAIVPTYNRANLVGRAIDSILAQRQPATEIIVVDDGSQDMTRRVVESYGCQVRYVNQENAGASVARNRGVNETTCEWIAFLDSDDYWTTGHLARMIDGIRRTEGAAALYFADLWVPGKPTGETYWRRCDFRIAGDLELRRDASDWALKRIQPMMLQASVIKRSAYLEVGGLADQLRTREDTLLFYKLGLLYPVCAVSGHGTVWTADDHSGRLTSFYGPDSLIHCHASVFLYQDLRNTLKKAGDKRHRMFTEALTSSYISLVRVLVHKHKLLGAMKYFLLGLAIAPGTVVREFRGLMVRLLIKTKNRMGQRPYMTA